ncbi:MAG TPA: hypothetical protein VFH29_04910 [Anaerolineales bacterium]|nr:hypothetical protein [Anaerolineales bacterium]
MRRRMIRRAGRTMRGIGVGAIPPLLLRSNQLLLAGEYVGAAEGLEQLARAVEGRRSRRAAHLYLEAGRARILGGDVDAGVILLDRGLRLLAASGATIQLARASRRVVQELSARGLHDKADQIRRSLADVGVSASDIAAMPVPETSRPILPVHCPGCGAPVHPDELEWLDEVTAECEYCGTPMRPE